MVHARSTDDLAGGTLFAGDLIFILLFLRDGVDSSTLGISDFIAEASFALAGIVDFLLFDLGSADFVVDVDLAILVIVLSTAIPERTKPTLKLFLLRNSRPLLHILETLHINLLSRLNLSITFRLPSSFQIYPLLYNLFRPFARLLTFPIRKEMLRLFLDVLFQDVVLLLGVVVDRRSANLLGVEIL